MRPGIRVARRNRPGLERGRTLGKEKFECEAGQDSAYLELFSTCELTMLQHLITMTEHLHKIADTRARGYQTTGVRNRVHRYDERRKIALADTSTKNASQEVMAWD
jgi:hypothetical protein